MRFASFTGRLVCLIAGGLCIALAKAEEPNDVFAANRALGRGVNLGNFLEAPRGADWGVRIVDDDFARIKRAGFDTVRLPVKWSDYAQVDPPYTIEGVFFQRVDHLLDVAQANRLNVVLNIHHYDGLDQDPERHSRRFFALWRQIAQRYRDRPASLYFELHNEPHDKLESQWNDVIREGLASIRPTNPTRPIVVGPVHWNSVAELSKLELPDDKWLIVTVHYYHPFEFTHQGAEWAEPRVRAIKDLHWEGSGTDLRLIRNEFDAVAAWAKQHQRPVFLGEFGSYRRAPLESRVRWTMTVAREAESRDFSWAYWEYAAGFGIFDRDRQSWRDSLLDALVPEAR